MKYAVTQVVNGNFSIVSEHDTDKQAAFVKFHDVCKIMWNAEDVETAMIKVVDENLDTVEGKQEYIFHAVPAPESEPEEEPEEEPTEPVEE